MSNEGKDASSAVWHKCWDESQAYQCEQALDVKRRVSGGVQVGAGAEGDFDMLAESSTYPRNSRLRLVVVNNVIERCDNLPGSVVDSGKQMAAVARNNEAVAPAIRRLSNIVEDRQSLRVCCGTCSATKTVDPRSLNLPEEMPLAEVRRTLKCDNCGGHWVDVRVTESAGAASRKDRPARIRR